MEGWEDMPGEKGVAGWEDVDCILSVVCFVYGSLGGLYTISSVAILLYFRVWCA